jgi:hypothetical protein
MNVLEVFEDSKKKIRAIFEGLNDKEKQENKEQFDKMIAEIDKNINEVSKVLKDAN